jgi:hypothetical protein
MGLSISGHRSARPPSSANETEVCTLSCSDQFRTSTTTTPPPTTLRCGAGRYVWLTPHGLGFLVDHNGTRPITAREARLILDAPPGVDIYPY